MSTCIYYYEIVGVDAKTINALWWHNPSRSYVDKSHLHPCRRQNTYETIALK